MLHNKHIRQLEAYHVEHLGDKIMKIGWEKKKLLGYEFLENAAMEVAIFELATS